MRTGIADPGGPDECAAGVDLLRLKALPFLTLFLNSFAIQSKVASEKHQYLFFCPVQKFVPLYLCDNQFRIGAKVVHSLNHRLMGSTCSLRYPV